MRSEGILIGLAYAVMCLIWGSTWMVIKIGLRGAPPITAVGLRFWVAALLVMMVVVMRGIRMPWSRHFLVLCGFLGISHMAMPYMLVYWAEQHITSGLTAVLYSTMPLMVALIAHYVVGERLTWVKLVGIGLGIVGVWIIFADSVRMSGSGAALGVVAVLGSVVFASISSVVVKKHGRRYNPIVLLLLPFWIGGTVALSVALPMERSNPVTYDLRTWMTILYLAAAGSVIAFTLLFWVIQRIEVTTVSYQTFIIPVLALVLGWVFLDETISARIGLGSLFVLAGIAFATFRRRRRSQSPAGVAFVVSLCVLVPRGVTAGSVTLGPCKDNTLYESQTGQLSNGTGCHFFAGRTGQGSGSIRRGLVAFDLADSIPAQSTIDSVTLRLNMSRSPSGSQLVHLHRVLTDWGEASSNGARGEGAGDLAEAGDVTWIHTFFETDFWTNSGGDFSSVPSASQTVVGTGFYTWGSTPLLVADVQSWLEDPQSSNGWILIGNESVGRSAKRFDSRNHPTASLRPKLTIYFTPPTLVDTRTWSGLKRLFR